jgi:hypothetical protein
MSLSTVRPETGTLPFLRGFPSWREIFESPSAIYFLNLEGDKPTELRHASCVFWGMFFYHSHEFLQPSVAAGLQSPKEPQAL